MDFYCFNQDCPDWSGQDAVMMGITLATWPVDPRPTCKHCGKEMIFHDNWINGDNRTHDDGTPVRDR